MPTKKLTYKQYKNILNRVAYKLVKNGKTYKHREKYTAGGETKTYKQIINLIKKNGTNYGHDKHIARFIEKLTKDNTDLSFLPASVKGSSGKTKYTRASYTDMIKRVIAYRKKNKKNPKKIKAKYKKIETKYGRATKKGCDNMGQNTGFYCGCHSMQEMFRNLYGIVVPQKTLASIMGTTSSGTDPQAFHTAVAWFNRKYDKNLVLEEYYFSDLGVDGIKKILKSDNKDCFFHLLYRDKYGHFECANSISGDIWKIQNSLGDKCSSGCYCGYVENRKYSDQKSYINGKTGVKSVKVFIRK